MRSQKCLRRLNAALQVLRLHRSQVEEHDDQPVIAQVFRPRDDNGLGSWPGRAGSQPAHRRFVQRLGHVHALKIEGGDLLLLAVLVDLEVALLEPAHKLAGLRVAHHHVGQHQFGVFLQHETALRR